MNMYPESTLTFNLAKSLAANVRSIRVFFSGRYCWVCVPMCASFLYLISVDHLLWIMFQRTHTYTYCTIFYIVSVYLSLYHLNIDIMNPIGHPFLPPNKNFSNKTCHKIYVVISMRNRLYAKWHKYSFYIML